MSSYVHRHSKHGHRHSYHRKSMHFSVRKILLAVFISIFVVFSYWCATQSSRPLILLGVYDFSGKTVDDLLSDFPALVVLIGTAVCLIYRFAPKRVVQVVFVLYILFIFGETLLRPIGVSRFNFDLFASYSRFSVSNTARIHILNNIWLFIPYGAGLYFTLKDKRWFVPLIFLPVGIELIQGVFGLGLFELDDIFSNTLGELIGIHIYQLIRKNRRRHIHKHITGGFK